MECLIFANIMFLQNSIRVMYGVWNKSRTNVAKLHFSTRIPSGQEPTNGLTKDCYKLYIFGNKRMMCNIAL